MRTLGDVWLGVNRKKHFNYPSRPTNGSLASIGLLTTKSLLASTSNSRAEWCVDRVGSVARLSQAAPTGADQTVWGVQYNARMNAEANK